MLFRSKLACFAFSQFTVALLVAILEREVFGFLPMYASKGEVLVTPSSVTRSIFKVL